MRASKPKADVDLKFLQRVDDDLDMRPFTISKETWSVCLLSILLAPAIASAQQGGSGALEEAVQQETAAIESICDASSARDVVPVLARLRESSRARTSVAVGLERCVAGHTSSSQSVLIVSYLEQVRRTDLLRSILVRSTSPRLNLRIAVSIANVEGDYGALSMAIGRAVEHRLSASDIRLTLRHLLPPRDRPVSDADILGRRALRTWLNHFGMLADSPFAQGG
jgi:hypothetical protein